MKKVRWAVIGATGFARLRTIPEGILGAPNAELSAILARDENRLREVARDFDDVFYTTNMGVLLARPDVDAVYIATPTKDHEKQTLSALRAGKHVLVEKPCAMNARQAQTMQNAASQNNLCLKTAFMMRYHGAHRKALQLIEQEKLGRLVHGRVQFAFDYPPQENNWRQDPRQGGGGAYMDVGTHGADLLELFLGPVQSVQAIAKNLVHRYSAEDSAVVFLEFQSGALGVVEAFFNIPMGFNALEISGTRGSLRATGTTGQSSGGELVLRAAPRGPEKALQYASINPYRAEIEDFSRAVLRGDFAAFNFDDGLQSTRVADAVYRAAKSGRRQQVSTA